MAGERYFSIGQGDAQVFNTGGLVNLYQFQLQKAAQRRQQEDEQLAKYVADFEYDGVRDADSPEIRNHYERILNLNKEYVNAKDKASRINLKAQIAKQMNDLGSAVQLSKNAKEQEKSLHQLTLNRNNKLLPDFTGKYGQLRQTSIFDPKYKQLAEDGVFQSPFEPDYDEDKTLNRILSKSISEVPTNARAAKVAGLSGNFLAQDSGKSLNRDQFFKAFEDELKTNEGLVYSIHKAGVNPQEYVEGLYNQYKDNYKTKTSYTSSNWQPRQERSEGDNIMITVGDSGVIPYGQSKDGKQPVVQPRNMVRLSPSRVNLAGTKAYDMNSGQPIDIPNMEDGVSISAIADFPFIKQKNSKGQPLKLRGQVAQPNFAKSNKDLVEDKRGAIITYKDADGFTVNAIVPVESLPRTKQLSKALQSLEKVAPSSKTQANQPKKRTKINY